MRSLELFAGAGGLAIGMARAGFQHAAVIEWDHDACETFRENQRHHAHAVEGWPVHEVDASQFDYSSLGSDISVISGGPPCQPFSMGGKHRGNQDERDMFPEAVRAVRELRPQAFIFENVKGLKRESFTSYFSYILLQLQYPEISRATNEEWAVHRDRLEQHHSANKAAATYNVLFDVLNAADFGVPQKRERVFIVGFRSDLGARWSFPSPTHSSDALLVSKWIQKDYWEEHEVPKARRPEPPERLSTRIERLRSSPPLLIAKRWRTTRDALLGLPDPEVDLDNVIPNHLFTPGARTYAGHTGSKLDEPAKTLKAGYHGVPGGENMFVKDDGGVRYFTVRESARLQTFPDEYEFHGSWSQTIRQLGNAVPVRLAEMVARSVANSLRACPDRGGQ
ncbi:DNA-cytosine methyltransferase [Mesorhizobium plurifarium]|uniref:DNA (cytosine-5-)-methyltransferase n=1 Tax=Mesorhizobium plurifarium TaxID=69974 RepID=A0A090DWU5_MESPL|nr:DNA-cytosine methyltransferase [Mesorhizobium plurifarium]